MSLIWLRVAVLLYGVAALAVLPAALYNRPRWRHVAMPAALGGAFFHFVALVETAVATHRALPVDTHETMSVLGLLLVIGFLLLAAKYRTVSFGIFLLPVAVLLTLLPAFRPGQELIAYPFIRTGWLVLHVVLLSGRVRRAISFAGSERPLFDPGTSSKTETWRARAHLAAAAGND